MRQTSALHPAGYPDVQQTARAQRSHSRLCPDPNPSLNSVLCGVWSGCGCWLSPRGHPIRVNPLPISRLMQKVLAARTTGNRPHYRRTGQPPCPHLPYRYIRPCNGIYHQQREAPACSRGRARGGGRRHHDQRRTACPRRVHGRAAQRAAPIAALPPQPGAAGSRALPSADAGKEGCEGGSTKFPALRTLIEVTNTP